MLPSVELRTPEGPPQRPLANCRAPHEKEYIVVVGFRSILAGAALLASTAAVSADGYYGGAKDTLIVPGYPASWYLRGDYSHAWVNVGDVAMPSFSFRDHSDDRTWAVGGGVGYYFGRGIRGDVTYEWRGGLDIHATTPTASTDLSIESSVLLANLYYDFRAGERLTPYIGVGLGAARHDTSGGRVVSTCGGICTYGGSDNWTAAGALMAGVSLRIDRGHRAPVSIKDGPVAAEPGRLHVDVGYRFLYLGDAHAGSLVNVSPVTPGPRVDDIVAHELRIGLRWDIR
jgi:opacity protein-like surface antigen